MNCDLAVNTNCSMTMEAVKAKSLEIVQKMFTEKKCKQTIVTDYQVKKRPECVLVTKKNCVTKWDHDEKGNKVSFCHVWRCKIPEPT